MFKKTFLILFLVFIPFLVKARIIFTEIMYDPAGTDTNKEYLEIKNTDNNDINLEGYRLYENETNHKLYDGFGNDFKLPANSYGVLVKNPDEFKTAYPDFSGFILKSSFSLKNSSGEEIALKDTNSDVLDILTYNPDSGGKDGDTLSLFENIWKNGQATPGSINIEKIPSNNNDEDNTEEDKPKINHSYSEITDMFEGQKKLHGEIDEIQPVMTGAKFEITGRAYGLSGVEIKGIDFLWNLGDGTKDYGQKITHEYYFPGEYLITLIVKSEGFTSPAVIQKIQVVAPPIIISTVDFNKKFIEIKNNSKKTLNIQGWILMTDGDKFVIPENTYILENGTIKFVSRHTHLRMDKKKKVFLLYPDGEKFQEFKPNNNSTILTETKIKDEDKTEITTPTPPLKNLPKITSLTVNTKPSQPSTKIVTPSITKIKKSSKKSTPKIITPTNTVINNNLTKDNTYQPTQQTASILPLKQEPNSFLEDNLIEISFTGLLLLMIFSLLFFKHHRPKNLALKQEADDFKILEED